MAVPLNNPPSPRLLRQGVIEAKTRGSRKQRKEKKNRTKKVEITMIKYTYFNLDLGRDYLNCSGARYRQGQGGPSWKEGEPPCYVNSPAPQRTRTHNSLPSKVPGLARKSLPCGLPCHCFCFSVNKWKNVTCFPLNIEI